MFTPVQQQQQHYTPYAPYPGHHHRQQQQLQEQEQQQQQNYHYEQPGVLQHRPTLSDLTEEEAAIVNTPEQLLRCESVLRVLIRLHRNAEL